MGSMGTSLISVYCRKGKELLENGFDSFFPEKEINSYERYCAHIVG